MKAHCHSRRHAELPELAERLRKKSHKLTGPRASILQVLRQNARPLSNKQIFVALRKGECNLVTVYRSIQLLESMGMVKRFDFGDGVARYELLRDGDDGHHHHLVCTKCAKVVEIDECFITEVEQRIAAANGYMAVTHKLEFFGICPECQ